MSTDLKALNAAISELVEPLRSPTRLIRQIPNMPGEYALDLPANLEADLRFFAYPASRLDEGVGGLQGQLRLFRLTIDGGVRSLELWHELFQLIDDTLSGARALNLGFMEFEQTSGIDGGMPQRTANFYRLSLSFTFEGIAEFF